PRGCSPWSTSCCPPWSWRRLTRATSSGWPRAAAKPTRKKWTSFPSSNALLSRMPRALISVSDKRGAPELARNLIELGWEIVSTGGTAKALTQEGIAVTPVEKITGFPEMMDGRLKTLHPAVHGGLLARRDLPEHMAAIAEHGIAPIDLVVVNLYPFRQTASRAGVAPEEVIEQIDIGGPSMLRSAAKNFASVTTVVD